MSTNVSKATAFFDRPSKSKIPFASNALATLLTSLIVVGSSSAYAAENRSVDIIQSEVTRLKELLNQAQQELQSATSGNAGDTNLLGTANNSGGAAGGDNNIELTQNNLVESAKKNSPDAESANSDVQEVLVRAERLKTLKAVHDEPASISVVTADDLHLELASDYQAITKRLANVTFNQSNTRGASLSIRGIGKRGFAEVQDPSVLVVLDGVSFGLTALGNFDFYDIETVEAQRGVTGTTGGKGGSAGQVSYSTKRPSFTPSAEFSITYGQRNTEILSAAAGGPIIDDLLAWRGAIYVDKGDGYYQNNYGYDKNNSFYNRARNAARVQFLLTPSTDFSARLSFDSQPKATQLENGLTFRHDQPLTYANGTLTDPNGTTARSKLAGFTNAGGTFTAPRAWFTDRPSSETPGRNYTAADYNAEEANGILASNEYQGQYLSTKGSSLDLNWDFDNVKVSSLTAYRDFYFDAHNDDVTSFDISKQGGGSVVYDQYSQEFTIKSKPGGVIEYQAGLYSIKTKDDVQSRTSWGSDAGAWNASTGQYNTLERNAKTNRGAGLALLKDSLEDAYKKADIYVDTQSNAIYGSLDWHETEKATLTTGLRVGTEDRSSRDVNLLLNNGSGGALNPVSVNALHPIALGGFDSTAVGLLTANNSTAQLNTADSVAYKYYGATITATPGAAYNSLTPDQQAQVAAAKAIRNAGIGLLYNSVTDNYDDTLFTGNISQSYKFSDELTAYGTLQHGEKSGTAFNISGVNAPVKAEKTDAIELGIKTFLFDNTFTFNIDIYRLNIHNYQQAIRVPDVYQIALNQQNNIETPVPPYTTAQGNLSKVIAQGIEFDGIYSGIDNFTFRFSGAYNDAHYADYPNAPLPAEQAYKSAQGILFLDQSGESLPGAPKYTFNIGAQYRKPVANYEFHSSVNAAYTGSYNNGDDFSTYTKIKGYWITDASIGVASPSNKFDLNLVVKNITDEAPHEEAWTTYEPYIYRRWVGLELSGKF